MRLATLLLTLTLTPSALSAQTWTPQASGTAANLTGVHFIDATNGVAVGETAVVLRTTDAGQTWAVQTLPADDLEGVAFNPSGTVGIAVSDDGPVFRTTDQGASWTSIATGAGDLRDVQWADDNVVWVAGRDGDSAVSSDAGLTWTYRSTGSTKRTESVAALSAGDAFVGNEEGELRRTTDGGLTWTTIATGTSRDLNDIQFVGQTGYIAANGDEVLKSVDGGASWTNVSNGLAEGDGLAFLDASTGWVVGDPGEVWFTDDGGATWTLQSSGTALPLNAVHFPTAVDGWAVGDLGTIVRFSAVPTAAEPAGGLEPALFRLSPTYPNPFSARTEFSLEVARQQHVSVSVVDGPGRLVARIFDGPLSAGTGHRFTVGSGLSGGTYTILVDGETFRAARTVTLIR